MECISIVPKNVPEEITETDFQNFFNVISTDLSEEQEARILNPEATYPRQKAVLAVHWHPEFIPFHLIEKRIDTLFPRRAVDLIIPTQHNTLMDRQGLTGVEVDCWSRGFNQKVQLLLHFRSDRLQHASVLKDMLEHTFQYRSSQLFDFLNTLIQPVEERINEAAEETGADASLVGFVRVYAKKIHELLHRHEAVVPRDSFKNKVIRNFFDTLRPVYGNRLIDRAQTFLRIVKLIVKRHFPSDYFYRASEVIEEARALGAGIVIPHPEQFWPILLADYDVDGYEVWNPQSRQYTEFLISVLCKRNRGLKPSERRILVFMGDDTHMGEKIRDPMVQDSAKAGREIGVQPAWEDPAIQKALIIADMDRAKVIAEYRDRLSA